ncbi:MAG: PIN domain-containing protein [Verrucomicrobia bacterium]|nr:PIN domain-containing protein [Verrucomicrobiota bacterium]
MPATVLDSHALVAYFRDEPGAGQVEALLTKAAQADRPLHMTEVNYAEAKYILIRKDGPAAWEAAARILVGLPIEFHPADRTLADSAGDFKSRFKLSLADAFAAALAKKHKAELVTGDPEFKAMEKEIKISWLA